MTGKTFNAVGEQVHPEYEALPECIKACVSPKEHLWMGDEERARLIEDLTLPEPEED